MLPDTGSPREECNAKCFHAPPLQSIWEKCPTKCYQEKADPAQYSHSQTKKDAEIWLSGLNRLKRDNTKTGGLSFWNLNQALFLQLCTEEALKHFLSPSRKPAAQPLRWARCHFGGRSYETPRRGVYSVLFMTTKGISTTEKEKGVKEEIKAVGGQIYQWEEEERERGKRREGEPSSTGYHSHAWAVQASTSNSDDT